MRSGAESKCKAHQGSSRHTLVVLVSNANSINRTGYQRPYLALWDTSYRLVFRILKFHPGASWLCIACTRLYYGFASFEWTMFWRVRLLALERSMGSLQHRLSHAEAWASTFVNTCLYSSCIQLSIFLAPLRLLDIFVSLAQDLSIPEKPKGAILGHLHFGILIFCASMLTNNCVDTRMLSVSCNSTSQRAIAQSQGQSSCYTIGTVMIWQWYGIMLSYEVILWIPMVLQLMLK